MIRSFLLFWTSFARNFGTLNIERKQSYSLNLGEITNVI